MSPTPYETNVLNAIEEKWAMFLRKLDDSEDKDVTVENASVKCKQLLEKIRNDYANQAVIENMYYHICIGNDFMFNESNEVEGRKHFQKALDVISSYSNNSERDYIFKESLNKIILKPCI